MQKLGIYIHIPFCLRKCPYCDFYSTASHDKETRERFLSALCKELENYGGQYGKSRNVDTVFFGGGTPSILEAEEVSRIMTKLAETFHIAENAEISMECNPATASAEKLVAYRAAGINRLSIGAQSFSDDVLRTLGRLHDAEATRQTVHEARMAGFENISLDLMFGIPSQTAEIWRDTVKEAMALKPQHISFYSLEFMEGTPFWKMREDGTMAETEAEADREMYGEALAIMAEGGYHQYEISNAAFGPAGENECRHNLKYWNLDDYLGFGPSAHSFIDNIRRSNPDKLEEYCTNVEAGKFGKEGSDFYTENTFMDNVAEYMFTGLRKTTGIDKSAFREKFGKDIWQIYGEDCRAEFTEYAGGGFAEETEECLRLTLSGMNISNRIMAIFV